MKILYITYELSSGGAERLVVDLTNKLSDNLNDEVHLMTIRSDDVEGNTFYKKDLQDSVKYHNVAIDHGFSLKALFRLHSYLKKIEPDVVHFHGINIIVYFVISILFYRKPKYFETLHNGADVIISLKRFSYVTVPIYKLKLVSLIAISHANYLTIKKKLKTKNTPIIYNGRTIDQVSSTYNDAVNEIDNYKKNSNEIIFIHVGRCDEQKNQQMMIEAFNKVSLKYSNIRLLIFGDGFNSDLGNRLKSMAGANIHFVGSRINILDYMRYSDAFLLSSRFEGMPITLIEALACNTVPICTPTSGVIDVIKNGVNGFVSNNLTLEAYQNSLIEYLENDLKGFEEAMTDTFNKYFTIESCLQKYYDMYTQAL